MKMKKLARKSLLFGIVLLQSHFWIVLTDDVIQGVTSTDNNSKSSIDDRPKTETDKVSQSSSHIFITSSFVTNPSSSALTMSEDYLISNSARTTSVSGTAFPIDADPVKLLNVSIQQTFSNSSSSHQNSSFVASPVVDSSSSHTLEPYNLSGVSSFLLADLSSHITERTYSHSTSSVFFVLQENNSSSSNDLYTFVESVSQRTDSMSLNEKIFPTPSAESRILFTSSRFLSSTKEFLNSDSVKSADIALSGEIQTDTSLNFQSQSGHILDSLSIDDFIPELKENKPTASLSQKINTDFSNFIIETSTKFQSALDSTKKYSDLEIPGASEEILSIKVPSSISNTGSLNINSSFRINNDEPKNESTNLFSHEIIRDEEATNNKTSRNEDEEIKDIISGIIHLLAGNVQVVRPGMGTNPSRHHLPPQPALVSTRINNRGPIRPNNLSRTVVVFSQPPNNGHPADIALPGHLFPSTIQNPQFVRVRPTKIGEHHPSAVIHFYQQGIKPPPPPPPPGKPLPFPPNHVPFNGEVFIPNNRPNNQVRNTVPPEEFVKPSFINSEKQQTLNGNPGNKHQHFIFSDEATSSVVVLRPSKQPPAETFTSIRQENPQKESSTSENVPSQSFEVLIDDTVKKKVFDSPVKTLSSPNFNKKVTPYGPYSSNVVIFPTKTESGFPHGPVTDWVPFAERPSVRDETNSFAADENVSIIMHPIIFDVTVSNSVGDVGINKYSAGNQNKSTLSVPVTEILNSQLNISSETIKPFSTSDVESVMLSSQTLGEKYLQHDSHLGKIINNNETSAQEFMESSSRTADVFSTQSTGLTSTSENKISSPTSITVTPDINLLSSFNQGYTYTEKRAFVERTENSEFSVKHTPSRPYSSVSSKSIEVTPTTPELTMIGRPFVIPVDIEEVRPHVGPINPPYQDRNRENQYPDPFAGTQRSTAADNIRKPTSRVPIIRSQARPRPNNVRIDTCIVGDDSTCDVNQNETCRTELGISSCHCRPGFARSYTRGPCIPIVSLMLSMKVDRYENKQLKFTPRYMNKNSEEFKFLEYEAKIALSSMLSQIPAFARTFLGLRINSFYPLGDRMAINSTIFLEEKESTRTQAVRLRLRQLIGEAIRNKQQNIGDSRLFADSSYSPITAIEDVNECSDKNLNDCSEGGMCFNVFGTYLCKCRTGYVDPYVHDERKSGRKCSACSLEYCSYHGKCFVEREKRLCKCQGNYIGSRCEIDGEVLGVALGASLAAIIIILLTLGCLCIWNRKWKQQQHKADILSSRSYNSNQAYGYPANAVNGSMNPYHLTMEDRMRWAQISDHMKNISEPTPDYLPPTPVPLDPTTFASRCQPSDDEMSWYDCRSRPRSRIMGQYGGVPGPTCFEMDVSSRMSYAGKSYHKSKRPKYPMTRH